MQVKRQSSNIFSIELCQIKRNAFIYQARYYTTNKTGKEEKNKELYVCRIRTSKLAILNLLGFQNHGIINFKVACSDRQPHPPFFSNIMEILAPEVESYIQKALCVKVSCTNSLQFNIVMSGNPSRKLENVVKQ